MDLAFYIYSYLQEQKPRVEVPDFGIFRLEKEHAVVDAESSKFFLQVSISILKTTPLSLILALPII